jgi:hypothetical protein
VIVEPLFPAPLNETVALLSPAIAATVVGAIGIPAGVTAVELVPGELPTAFLATAVNV